MAAEFNHPDLDEIFSGRIEDLAQNDLEIGVPLEQRSDMDPFYQAQVFQQGLQEAVDPSLTMSELNGMPVHVYMGLYAIDVLNDQYAEQIRNRRLAFTTFVLSAINLERRTSDSYEGKAIVTGIFERFDFARIKGNDTIIAQLEKPRFIDPRLVNHESVHKLALPVLGLSEWASDPRIV